MDGMEIKTFGNLVASLSDYLVNMHGMPLALYKRWINYDYMAPESLLEF